MMSKSTCSLEKASHQSLLGHAVSTLCPIRGPVQHLTRGTVCGKGGTGVGPTPPRLLGARPSDSDSVAHCREQPPRPDGSLTFAKGSSRFKNSPREAWTQFPQGRCLHVLACAPQPWTVKTTTRGHRAVKKYAQPQEQKRSRRHP